MTRDIPATMPQAMEGISSLGNLNHWGWWVATLESQIAERSEEKRPLADAPNYVAWLLMSAEHLAYRLRWHFYADGSFGEGIVFDEAYAALLLRCKVIMPPGVHDAASFAISVRHVLVHKGFPNPHLAPMQRNGGKDAAAFLDVRDAMLMPSNYPVIRAKFQSVHQWLNGASPSVSFGI